MRVLHVITQARGGPVDHAVDVAAEQHRRGWETHLAGPPGAYAERAAAAGVTVHPSTIDSKTDLVGARRLHRIVRDVRPDVVHLQDRRAGLMGRPVAWGNGVPAVYTLHGVPDPLAPLVPGNGTIVAARRSDRIENLALERLLARTPRSVVVTPCRAVARYARDHVGVPAPLVHAVHNGVADSWLEAPARTRSGSGPDAPVRAAWLGVMAPVKRVTHLVRALAAVPGLHLDLIGDGPERPAVEAAVLDADVADRVRLHGFVADPAPLLDDVDLLVLPSAAEACPMAVLQAMARGLPVVATRAGGIPEVVREGRDGLLVDGDEHGLESRLTEALRTLTVDADLRHRLGHSARARVEEHFTIGRCVDDLAEIYREVAR